MTRTMVSGSGRSKECEVLCASGQTNDVSSVHTHCKMEFAIVAAPGRQERHVSCHTSTSDLNRRILNVAERVLNNGNVGGGGAKTCKRYDCMTFETVFQVTVIAKVAGV